VLSTQGTTLVITVFVGVAADVLTDVVAVHIIRSRLLGTIVLGYLLDL
jgi:hypothetical protein